MAAGDMNKSEMIREFKAANPKAKPKQIAEALNEKLSAGNQITPQYVSTILSNARRAGRMAVPGSNGDYALEGVDFDLDQLHKAKQLIEATGSISEAISCLECLGMITPEISQTNP